MLVGVPAETAPGEKRVALTPDAVGILIGQGLSVCVESGAGKGSLIEDSEYLEAGAEIVAGHHETISRADVVVKVVGPSDGEPGSEADSLREGSVLIATLAPQINLETVRLLAARNVTAFAMDLMPRISRAQSMDTITSMSTIGGYKAALLAACALPKFFPMLMTAAGTLPPARVLVIGAGVAGLQAIATCRRLGAIVEAFDVRPAVKEQVESLGARYVDLGLHADEYEDAGGYAKEVTGDTHAKELAAIASRLPKTDVVITTALVPGKRAPILISKEMLKLLPKGAIVVDLAAVNGGNCEATVPGQTTLYDGVTIMAPLDLPSTTAVHASRMYAKNVTEFLGYLIRDKEIVLDLEDELIRGPLVTYQGKVMHEPTRLKLERPKPQ